MESGYLFDYFLDAFKIVFGNRNPAPYPLRISNLFRPLLYTYDWIDYDLVSAYQTHKDV